MSNRDATREGLVIHKNHADYPPLLRTIYDYPKKLFVRGNLQPKRLIAVVGSRRATSYGKRAIEKIIPTLVEHDFGIVSGLAYGIDTLAHRATLDSDGYTVAVLAGGLDMVYPNVNQKLACDIVNSAGALLSEQPAGTSSQKFMFPVRNRIIAAMCEVTIVVEAAAKSGSLITAYQALEYNRFVGAVPGSIFSSVSSGTNAIISRGAFPVCSGEDVLQLLGIDLEKKKKERIAINEKFEKVYALLSQDPTHIDALLEECSLPNEKILRTVIEMELEGLITDVGGKRYICQK